MFYGTCPWVYYIKAGSRQWKKHLMRMMNTMDGLDCPAVSIIIGIPYKPRKSHSFHRSSPCHPLYLMEFHPRHSSVLIRIRRIIFLVLPPPNSIKIKQWKDIAANWAWNGQDNEVRWWFFYYNNLFDSGFFIQRAYLEWKEDFACFRKWVPNDKWINVSSLSSYRYR